MAHPVVLQPPACLGNRRLFSLATKASGRAGERLAENPLLPSPQYCMLRCERLCVVAVFWIRSSRGRAGLLFRVRSLATRWVRDEFDEHNVPTMGSAFLTKSVPVSVASVTDPTVVDDTVLRIHLWDTAGEERYHAVAKSFFRGAKGAILVYDITNPSSMEGIRSWARMVESEAPDAVKFLVGTKCDLEERASVSEEDARAMASDITMGFTASFRASALTGEGVHDVFDTLAQMLAERIAR